MVTYRELWKETSPTGAIADLRTVYQQAGKNRWWLMALAALTTFVTFSAIAGETWKGKRPLPEITYITSWPAHRTDAETKAFIVENQKRKEARQAELDRIRATEREMYKALGRASGFDVDAMEKRAEAERKAEEAAEAARIDAIRKANAAKN